jgi:hypothetical protein
MVSVGPGLGTFVAVREELMRKLLEEFQAMIKVEMRAQQKARTEIGRYVDELAKEAATAAGRAGAHAQETASDGSGESAAANSDAA